MRSTAPTAPTAPAARDVSLRVGLVTGTLAPFDAISDSLRLKIEALRELRARGVPIDVEVFCHGCDDDLRGRLGVPVHTGSTSHILSRTPFARQDVTVFEFGVYYSLFDAVFAVREPAAAIGVFHNFTPPDLVETSGRAAVRRASRQAKNLGYLGAILCDSELNHQELTALGIGELPSSVVHLPGRRSSWTLRPVDRSRITHPRCRLVFVGRFVRAKGVLDLLEALDASSAPTAVEATFVGDPRFSDPECTSAIRRACEAHGSSSVHMRTCLPDAELDELLTQADALVLPTYHEGLGLPVVEAYRAGCPVIGYDVANMPHVSGGLAHLVPVGDVPALTRAIDDLAASTIDHATRRNAQPVRTASGDIGRMQWLDLVADHLVDYSPERFTALVQRAVLVAAGRLATPPPWLDDVLEPFAPAP